MSDTAKRDRTRHLIDAALRRMTELDARLGIESMLELDGPAPGSEEMAFAIGVKTLETAADSYGLDPAELLRAANDRSGLQTSALLAALRIRLDPSGLELVSGSCSGGILTGIRLGLMLAELIAQEPSEEAA